MKLNTPTRTVCENDASFSVNLYDIAVELGDNPTICAGETTTVFAQVTGGTAPIQLFVEPYFTGSGFP